MQTYLPYNGDEDEAPVSQTDNSESMPLSEEPPAEQTENSETVQRNYE